MTRILFVTSTRIGDAVLSTGVLQHLINEHPGARVTVAAGAVAAPLFAALPQVQRIIPIEKKRYGLHWPELWAQVAGRRWEVVVDLRRSALPWLLVAGRRYVLGPDDPDTHRVERLAAMVGLAHTPPPPKLWLAPEHRNGARRRLPKGRLVLAVGPAANWAGKIWPPDRFAELIRRLTRRTGPLPNALVAVLGSPDEVHLAQPVLDAIPDDRRINLTIGLGLLSAAACLERCALFVGNDSGLMHMAAAVGTPTLGLFGPSRHQHYRPWGAHAAFVRTEKSWEELCPPGFDHRNTGTLMESLSVDAAEDAARSLLLRVGRRAPRD